MTEEESEASYGKGIPARQLCTDEILISLMNGEMTFTNFIDQFKNRASRGTVNRYLDELSDNSNGKINLIAHKNERRNLGPYILTEAGKKAAEERLPSYVFRTVTNQERNQFIHNYKMLVTHQIFLHLFQQVIGPAPRERESPNAGYSLDTRARVYKEYYPPRVRARVFNGYKEKKLNRYEVTEKISIAIEKDLLSLDFTKVEIIKLWLLADGYLIQDILLNLGAPEFWKLFSRESPPICEVIPPEQYSQIDREFMIKQTKKTLQTVLL
jgi:hypothetical protein